MTVKELEGLKPLEAKAALEKLPLKEVFTLIEEATPEYVSTLGECDEFVDWIGPLIRENHPLRDEVAKEVTGRK